MVLATAGFVVWAVGTSGGGGRATTASVSAPPPPQASPISVRLSNAIGRANLGPAHRAVDLTAVAPFAWERFYVFAGEARADIERRLGFNWSGAPATVPQNETLLAFVRGRTIAGSAFFSDAIGQLDCLGAPGGYPRGTRFTVRFGRHREAFLSTAAPDAGERACLRASHVAG